MRITPAVRPRRSGDIRQDWISWLPRETAQVFEHLRQELATSCLVLGVIVNEGLSASPEETLATTAQLAVLFAGVFDRLVAHLGIVLSALEQHNRACDTHPNAVPLLPAYFRSRNARHLARASQLRSYLSITKRSDFGPKLAALRKVIASLQHQARKEVREVTAVESGCARERWARLEVLQYDLNTCLQETTVILKSFFCALPDNELQLFRSRLPAWIRQPLLPAGRPHGF